MASGRQSRISGSGVARFDLRSRTGGSQSGLSSSATACCLAYLHHNDSDHIHPPTHPPTRVSHPPNLEPLPTTPTVTPPIPTCQCPASTDPPRPTAPPTPHTPPIIPPTPHCPPLHHHHHPAHPARTPLPPGKGSDEWTCVPVAPCQPLAARPEHHMTASRACYPGDNEEWIYLLHHPAGPLWPASTDERPPSPAAALGRPLLPGSYRGGLSSGVRVPPPPLPHLHPLPAAPTSPHSSLQPPLN